jgi:hypothetical protein
MLLQPVIQAVFAALEGGECVPAERRAAWMAGILRAGRSSEWANWLNASTSSTVRVSMVLAISLCFGSVAIVSSLFDEATVARFRQLDNLSATSTSA